MLPAPGRRLFALTIVVLLALHVWPPAPGLELVVFGWLPWDLAVHVAWMVFAAGAVHWMAQSLWPDAPRASADTTASPGQPQERDG